MRQAALNADFGCAQLPGFEGFFTHLLWGQKICVGFARAAAEGAEFASHKTNIGEIYISVDYICHEIAAEFGAEQVGGGEQAEEVVAFAVSEIVSFLDRNAVSVLSFKNLFYGRANRRSDAQRDAGPIERWEVFQFRG